MDSTTDLPGSTGLTHASDELVRVISLLGGADEIPTLDQLVTLALTVVPSAESVSTTSLRHGRFATSAATDDLSRQGDALQYEIGSGPCVDAVLEEATYVPHDLAHDARWPTFGRRVTSELGVRSMMAFRLYTEGDDTISGLNLYSRQAHAFSDDDLLRGLLVAAQASLAITKTKARHLAKALGTSREIGAAIGILMSVNKVTYDAAFDLLRVASQYSNRSLRDIATQVVETGTLALPHGA